jgi:hypothetical protein
MARFIGASTRCAPWGLWIWFKDGRDYETGCRFDHQEDAENYARKRLADSEEVEQFAVHWAFAGLLAAYLRAQLTRSCGSGSLGNVACGSAWYQ